MPASQSGGRVMFAPPKVRCDEAAAADERSAPRRLERIRGQLSFGDARNRVGCRIINMSATGACVEADEGSPALSVLLCRDRLALILPTENAFIECTIVWHERERLGLHFCSAFLQRIPFHSNL